MSSFVHLQNQVDLAQYEFCEGLVCGRRLDTNKRLVLRVLDTGTLKRLSAWEKRFVRSADLCEKTFFTSWLVGPLEALCHVNSKRVREHLLRTLQTGMVYIQEVDKRTNEHYFRPVPKELVPDLCRYLEDEHHFRIYFMANSDPTQVPATHLDTYA